MLGTITGLRRAGLAEPDVAPELDIPLWTFLVRASRPTGCCPGAGDIPRRPGARRADQPDVRRRRPDRRQPPDARRAALAQHPDHDRAGRRCAGSGSASTSAAARPRRDIRPGRHAWRRTSRSGPTPACSATLAHLRRSGHGPNLVVVLHTELFRRYPATIVYLTPNAGGADVWGRRPTSTTPAPRPAVPDLQRDDRRPSSSSSASGVAAGGGADHWLVLEEPPPGYRFRPSATTAPANGATFARDAFAEPVRVCFGNLLP